VFELAPGRADHRPAGRGEALIAPAIGLEGLGRAVRPAAIGLDHDLEVGPGEIGPDQWLAVAQVDVELGARVGKPEAAGEREERVLEVVLGRRASDVVGLEEVADGLGGGAGGVASELVVDGVQVEGLHDLGLVERPLELAGGQDLAEVEQRSRHRGHGDVLDDGDVGCGESGRAMNGDT
jgi:hypothetical protein